MRAMSYSCTAYWHAAGSKVWWLISILEAVEAPELIRWIDDLHK